MSHPGQQALRVNRGNALRIVGSMRVGAALRDGAARRLRLPQGESKQPREEISTAEYRFGHGKHLPSSRVVPALDRRVRDLALVALHDGEQGLVPAVHIGAEL